MKTFKVSKPCSVSALITALAAAGVDTAHREFTVRASYVGKDKTDKPAAYAAVVAPDSVTDSVVRAAITAHVATGAPSVTPSASDLERAVDRLEKMPARGSQIGEVRI